MIVRQYEIKDECSEVTILASGDIAYNNVTLKAKFEGIVEKFCKITEPIGYTVPRIYDNLRHPINNYRKDRYDTAIMGQFKNLIYSFAEIKIIQLSFFSQTRIILTSFYNFRPFFVEKWP